MRTFSSVSDIRNKPAQCASSVIRHVNVQAYVQPEILYRPWSLCAGPGLVRSVLQIVPSKCRTSAVGPRASIFRVEM